MPQTSARRLIVIALRRWLPQIGVLALLVLLLGWLGHNVLENMRERGIRAGFDFLLDPAGFER